MQWSVEIRDVETLDFSDLDGVLSLLGEPLLGFAGSDRGLLERRASKMLDELHSMFTFSQAWPSNSLLLNLWAGSTVRSFWMRSSASLETSSALEGNT